MQLFNRRTERDRRNSVFRGRVFDMDMLNTDHGQLMFITETGRHMPINRIVAIIFVFVLSPFAIADEIPGISLPAHELRYLAERIYQNECAGKERNLTHWNEGENFPSLGIGHFIWYPAGSAEPFQESFPALIAFYRARRVSIPPWLDKLHPFAAPWASREQFYRQIDDAAMVQLRRWLSDTRSVQAEFLAERFRSVLPKLLAAAAAGQQASVSRKLDALMATPGGFYPLIDYINFKGDGTVQSERYQGQGWGLLQVLSEMRESEAGPQALHAFADAAETVLQRRVANSPSARNEQRWLQGWLKRVDTYRGQ